MAKESCKSFIWKFHSLAQIIFIQLIHANKCFLTLKLLPSFLCCFILQNSIQISKLCFNNFFQILLYFFLFSFSLLQSTNLYPIFFNYLLVFTFTFLFYYLSFELYDVKRLFIRFVCVCVCMLYPRH